MAAVRRSAAGFDIYDKEKISRVLGRENRSWQDTEMQSAACAAGKGRNYF
jgi:hypothetical protein